MKDMHNSLRAIKSILAIVGNNDTEGTGLTVDLQGYEGALVVFNVGQSGDTLSGSVYITLKVQESDDDSSWSDVANADLVGGNNSIVIDAAAEDEVVHQRSYIGNKRYVRALVDFTGTHTNGIPIAAEVIRGIPRHAPIS